MFRIGLIDDEEKHRKYFAEQIEEILPAVPHRISEFSNPEQLFMDVEDNDQQIFDVLIVDLHYKNRSRNGLDFVRDFQKIHPYIDIIFVSSYLEYAPKVYDVEHISFIYKGDMGHYFRSALLKAVGNKEDRDQKFLKLRWKNTFYRIPYNDILYIEKILRKTNVHTRTGVYTTYTRMDDIMNELDHRYMRVHFSYIINRDYVFEFHSDNIKLFNGVNIPVSRTYSKAVMDYVASEFNPQSDSRHAPASVQKTKNDSEEKNEP